MRFRRYEWAFQTGILYRQQLPRDVNRDTFFFYGNMQRFDLMTNKNDYKPRLHTHNSNVLRVCRISALALASRQWRRPSRTRQRCENNTDKCWELAVTYLILVGQLQVRNGSNGMISMGTRVSKPSSLDFAHSWQPIKKEKFSVKIVTRVQSHDVLSLNTAHTTLI